MPNMTVIVPCDAIETRKATVDAAKTGHPVYLRLTREKTPIITSEESPFEIGRSEIFWNSATYRVRPCTPEVAIIACGPLVYQCLVTAQQLHEEGVGVIIVNCHTVKPLDTATLLRVARDCGAIITVEEHQVHGGLGGAVAELLAANLPTPIEFVGMPDSFGESGQPDELLAKYHMNAPAIKQAVLRVLQRKVVSKSA